jgi:predicted component of type VI protein secretion system
VSKPAGKVAQELLDRFFRDAEGRTNRQIDVYFTLQDMGLSREKADPAIEFLVSRGLVNTFGPDIAFLTDAGVSAVAADADIEQLPRAVRDFGVSGSKSEVSEHEVSEPITADAPAPNSGPVRPRIVHIGTAGEERVIELQWVCSLGRSDDNDIVLTDQRASKHHAEVRYEEGAYVLYDLDSANGTLHNGQYVVEPTRLRHDDEVVIGRTMLLIQAPDGVPVPTAPPPPSTLPSAPPPTGSPTERPEPAPDEVGTADLVPSDKLGTEKVPPAILTPPPADAFEPLPLDPADLEPLDPAALQPLEPQPLGAPVGESYEPPVATPPVPAVDASPAERPLADTLLSGPPAEAERPSSGLSEPALPTGPSDREPAEDDVDDAATIMTTREALFGEGSVPGQEEPGPTVPSPPALAALEAEAESMPSADPLMGAEAAAPEPEPALITLLTQLQDQLEDDVGPDRRELLEAVHLIRTHPSVRRLARQLEESVFGDGHG